MTNPRPHRIIDAARWLLPVLAAFVLAACGGDGDSSRSTLAVPTRTLIPPTATPTPVRTPLTPTPTDLPSAGALVPSGDEAGAEAFTPQTIIARALEQLVDTHEDIAAQDVRLMSLDAITWDGESWDCASPGMIDDRDPADAAAGTPGYRIVFHADNRAFVYHADEYGSMLACEDRAWLGLEGEPIPVEPIAEAMVDLSRQDAVRRLDLDPNELELVSLVTVTWPDAAVGCPKPGGEYDDRETQGYRIVFAVDDERVVYHTSVKDVVYCTPGEEILPAVLRRALPVDGEAE